MFRIDPSLIDDIIWGQYIWIAMPVKNDAISGDIPLLPRIWDATDAKFFPGSTSIGHTSCPSWTAAPGSL